MDNREPILFIAYQFPPQGGPGVHRSVRFVKNLREFSFEPIVLTRDIHSLENSHYPIDNDLLAALPNNLTIVRVNSNEKNKWRAILLKLRLYGIYWYLFYNSNWEGSLSWSNKSYHTAKDLIIKNNIKVIYTSSAPFSSLFLANKLKETLGVKWVADLRDPWTDAFTWQWPSPRHWKKDQIREKEILNNADTIIVVTNEMKKIYLDRGIGTSETIKVIYNGF